MTDPIKIAETQRKTIALIMFYAGVELINHYITQTPKSSWKHKTKQYVGFLDQHFSDPTSEYNRVTPEAKAMIDLVLTRYKGVIEAIVKIDDIAKLNLFVAVADDIAKGEAIIADSDGVDPKIEYSRFLFEVLHHARQTDNHKLNAILNKYGFDIEAHKTAPVERIMVLMSEPIENRKSN